MAHKLQHKHQKKKGYFSTQDPTHATYTVNKYISKVRIKCSLQNVLNLLEKYKQFQSTNKH